MYRWTSPENYPNKNVGQYQYDICDFLLFYSVNPINEKHEIPVVKFKATLEYLKKYDCLTNNTQIPIVNERFKVFLEKNTINCINFYPVEIIAKDGEINDYYILHFIKSLPLVNLDMSIYFYMTDEKTILGFTKTVFLKNVLQDNEIARSKEYNSYLMVPDKLVEKIKKEKFKGIDFYPVEEV